MKTPLEKLAKVGRNKDFINSKRQRVEEIEKRMEELKKETHGKRPKKNRV